MSDDDLAAATSGFLEGVRDIAAPFFIGKIRKRQEEDFLTRRRERQAIPGKRVEQLTGIDLGLGDNDKIYPEEAALLQTRISAEKQAQALQAQLGLITFRQGLQETSQVKQEERAEKRKEGVVSQAETGRDVLAREAIQSIGKARKILFPKGTAKSFNRRIATTSNIPFIGGSLPFDFEAQEVNRLLGGALSGRVLIKTGVAARPEEIQEERERFLSGLGSNPQAAFNALEQLESFYKDYRTGLRTKGRGIEPERPEREVVGDDELDNVFGEFE